MHDPREIVGESFQEGNLGGNMLQDFREVYSHYKTEVQQNHLAIYQKNCNGHPPDEDEVRTAIALLHSVAATAALNLLMDTLLNTVCNHFDIGKDSPRMEPLMENMAETAKRANDVVLDFLEQEGVPVLRIDDWDKDV